MAVDSAWVPAPEEASLLLSLSTIFEHQKDAFEYEAELVDALKVRLQAMQDGCQRDPRLDPPPSAEI